MTAMTIRRIGPSKPVKPPDAAGADGPAADAGLALPAMIGASNVPDSEGSGDAEKSLAEGGAVSSTMIPVSFGSDGIVVLAAAVAVGDGRLVGDIERDGVGPGPISIVPCKAVFGGTWRRTVYGYVPVAVGFQGVEVAPGWILGRMVLPIVTT